MNMELFLNLLVNPKLILSEIRPRSSWLISIAVMFLACSSLIMGNFIAYGRDGGLWQWLVNSTLFAVLSIFIVYFYLPLIHALAERFMPQSRVSDLLVYAGFSFAPLLLAFPLAMLLSVSRSGPLIYSLLSIILFFRIIGNISAGVRDNYNISPGRAAWYTILPSLLIFIFPVIFAVLSLMLYYD
ncbi:MAG: hypothetical protein ABII64_08555 [Elusimicrobiota bacterium]